MLIYTIIYPLILFLSRIKIKEQFIFRILALLILILFIGLRYDVGMDYYAYEKAFLLYSEKTAIGYIYEPGFMFLMKSIKDVSNDFYVLTLIVALIQIYFLYRGLKGFEYYTFSLFFFLVMMEGYAFIVNGMRQGISMCIFFYALKFINEKKFLIYGALLLLASLFHASALILFPLYFVLGFQLKGRLYIVFFLLTLIISQTGIIAKILLKILELTPYSNYIYSDFIDSSGTNSGLAFWIINLLGSVVLISYSYLLKKRSDYLIYFNLFFFFLLFRNLFFSVRIFMRIVPYLAISALIVYPLAINSFGGKISILLFKILVVTFYSLAFLAWIIFSEQPYQIVAL